MSNLILSICIIIVMILAWIATPYISFLPSLAFGIALGLIGGIPAVLITFNR